MSDPTTRRATAARSQPPALRPKTVALAGVAVMTLILAALAFTLSFDALRALAIDIGVRPQRAWMAPVAIDIAQAAAPPDSLSSASPTSTRPPAGTAWASPRSPSYSALPATRTTPTVWPTEPRTRWSGAGPRLHPATAYRRRVHRRDLPAAVARTAAPVHHHAASHRRRTHRGRHECKHAGTGHDATRQRTRADNHHQHGAQRCSRRRYRSGRRCARRCVRRAPRHRACNSRCIRQSARRRRGCTRGHRYTRHIARRCHRGRPRDHRGTPGNNPRHRRCTDAGPRPRARGNPHRLPADPCRSARFPRRRRSQ
ncbi:DUF2637 domain-containing protein [Rhodococcus hoagii]|nr:DUF2637 domain-containing protein [Prescottella equi]